MTPHKCPVCDGVGTTMRPPTDDQEVWYDDTGPYECPACKGSGVVWEPEAPTPTVNINRQAVPLNDPDLATIERLLQKAKTHQVVGKQIARSLATEGKIPPNTPQKGKPCHSKAGSQWV